jgi:UDP-glucuronate 4-epimerase
LQAEKIMAPMQAGDVIRTWADVSALQRDYNYCPTTSISEGVSAFVNWYKDFFEVR